MSIWKDFHQTHTDSDTVLFINNWNSKSWFVIAPENILFAGICVCTFKSKNTKAWTVKGLIKD